VHEALQLLMLELSPAINQCPECVNDMLLDKLNILYCKVVIYANSNGYVGFVI
jgi:hypothetical protein